MVRIVLQQIRAISCLHLKCNEITSDDGEILCGNCGVVLGRDNPPTIINSQSKSNLFLESEIGSKPNNSIKASKYIHAENSMLSTVSNICRTLEIPNFVSRDIWLWYNRIKANIKTTKAKIMILVIYQLCRYNKIPVNESKLLEVIRSNLKVKNIYSTLSVIAEIYSFLDSTGTPTIVRLGFSQFTVHDSIFLLRSKIKTLNDKYPPRTVSYVNDVALSILPTISGSEEQRAKKCFNIAKLRCGLC